MSVLKNLKNTPRSPHHRATGTKCIFFQIRNEVPGQKKIQGGMSPPSGDQWAPPTGAAGDCPPPWATGGPVAPPRATGVPLYKDLIPITSSFEPENSIKNPEKKERGEEKGSGEALPDSALVICRLVHLDYN